jgi:hypothetical protein
MILIQAIRLLNCRSFHCNISSFGGQSRKRLYLSEWVESDFAITMSRRPKTNTQLWEVLYLFQDCSIAYVKFLQGAANRILYYTTRLRLGYHLYSTKNINLRKFFRKLSKTFLVISFYNIIMS